MLWLPLTTVLYSALVVSALPEVKVGRTTLVGRDASDQVEFYGGIPFAEPPIGKRRLKQPVLRTRMTAASFNASSHGKACVQPGMDPSAISEDCLTINVYRPTGVRQNAKLPVLFWTHGGGFLVGSSQMTDGTILVTRSIARGTPIIYVDFNYRLGVLGFPQGQEADDRRSLNLGVHDQTAALEWIQANIQFFGGDKHKVTMFGESAGAMLIGVQYLNPRLGRLARGAILESGSANGPATYPAARHEGLWQDFVSAVPSCASIATSGRVFSCLERASTEDVTAGVLQSSNPQGLPWATPTVDTGRGSVFPDYASRLFERGQFARVPFIAGVNLDEGTFFASQAPQTTEDLKALFVGLSSPPMTTQQELDNTIDHILTLYPEDPVVGSPYGTGNELFGLPASYKRHSSIMGDLTWDSPRRQFSRAAASVGLKSYGYRFTHRTQVLPPQFGVAHATEIPFVYGQIPAADPIGFNLSVAMMDYWISFTVSLDPNDAKGSPRPQWPQYTAGANGQRLLQLEGVNTTVIPDTFREEQIDFLIQNSLILRR